MRKIIVLLFASLAVACSSSAPAPEPEPAPVAPVAPAPTAEAAPIGTVRVTASTLNVRSEPSGSVIAQVRRNERLPLLATEGDWMKVRLSSGEIGWVSRQHVTTADAAAPTRTATRRRGRCPPDSDYRFVKAPTPRFSDSDKHGLVVVEANVNANGDVTSTKVISNTTGDEALAFLTQQELKTAKFAPPVRNCVPKAFIFTYKRSF